MENKIPFRLRATRILCYSLPPIISQSVRSLLYPKHIAYRDNCDFTVKAQTGSLYNGNTLDHHSYPFGVHGFYFWRAWAIALAVCQPGNTIIEVGGNVGTETIGFSDIVGERGRVITFEPLPSNVSLLIDSVAGAQWKNIIIHPFAVGDQLATVYFASPEKAENSGIGYVVTGEKLFKENFIEVRCVLLDSYLDGHIAPRMVFIDVEGFEVRVLRGAKQTINTHKPILMLEASPKLLKRAGFTLGELLAELNGLGYVPFGISKLKVVQMKSVNEKVLGNWVCIHKSELSLVKKINRYLLLCGLLPCVPGINPMSSKHDRNGR